MSLLTDHDDVPLDELVGSLRAQGPRNTLSILLNMEVNCLCSLKHTLTYFAVSVFLHNPHSFENLNLDEGGPPFFFLLFKKIKNKTFRASN